MDYGILPPEINSARIYAGPGSEPMLAAASAWGGLAAELGSAVSSYTGVISELTDGSWHGPASASMASAASGYVTWMSTAAAQAEQTASQAQAAAAAFEAAFSLTVPPALVAANRVQLAALVATNVVGQNTAAIAATEALYGEMWAQDAAAMYTYAGSSAAAATVTPFSSPPQTTNPAAAASQAGAVSQSTGTGVQSTLSQVVSTVPSTLQGLSSPLSSASLGVNPFAPGSNTATTGIAGLLNLLSGQTGSAFGSFITSGFANGVLSGNWFNPASLMPAVTSSFGDIGFLAVAGQAGGSFGGMNPALFSAATAPSAMSTIGSIGSSGSGVSAGVGRATLVGTMSVPHSWAAATPSMSTPAAATQAAGTQVPGWTIPPGAGLEEVSRTQGMPGMPGMPMGAGAPRGYGFAAPRYGFRPTVVAHPPAAG
jgi:PPE-repeat protein